MKPATRRARLKGRLRCLRAPCRLDQAVLMIDVPYLSIGQPTRSLAKGSKNDGFGGPRWGNTVFIQAFYARNFT
jgi:hypothetical protein